MAFATTAVIVSAIAGSASAARPAAEPSRAVAAAQGVTANTILIGLDAIESGPIAPAFVSADEYFKAWVQATNASGGLDGRKIRTIELDSAGSPTQTLTNYKTLWDQDHVAAIVEIGIATPDAYVTSAQIPTFTNGASPEDYASADNTVFPLVGTIEAWAAESAYYLVKVQNKLPTSVGILTDGTDPYMDSYIENYWEKLGVPVSKLDLEQGFPPGGSCSSDILKWRSLNIDYIDFQDTSGTPACLLAEAQLGWKPALGQGGIGASSTATAEQVGAPFNGLLGGAPDVNYLGAPFSTTPTPALKTYVANIKKYVPSTYATPTYFDSAITSGYYSIAQVVTQAFGGAINYYGSKMTTQEFVRYVHGMKNIATATVAPIPSLAASCKTGSDGTVWGYWHYNASTKVETFEPTPEKTWVSTSYLGSECYLTRYISKLFPKG